MYAHVIALPMSDRNFNQFGDPANNNIRLLRSGEISNLVRGRPPLMMQLARVDEDVPLTPEGG